MFTINHEVIAGVPTLHVSNQSLLDKKTPVVFFIHGFTSAKEHNLHYAYLLANEGFRVYLPEVYLHGERLDHSNISTEKIYYKFWDMVIQTIHELNEIRKELVRKALIDEQRIGLAGLSMGGIITLGALKQYEWIKTAVSLMGCPAYKQFANGLITEIKRQGEKLPFTDEELEEKINELKPYDLSLEPEKLYNRPLLFWHGKEDSVVPYDYAYEFYVNNKDLYKSNPEKFKFLSEPKAGHKVSRNGVLETVQWFRKFL
ncbi:alpha/beta superfamily hydrolase [Schinkia azotoformans MEV2011]|uniref:Alpha/beta superfamily hydrolase n=1 Tax=Schinkia azotoformans MEV2011 TaxID=1348973 RepID=A0A072NLF8_SCHAZ|nr:prolyl oligopeptidase family serine peptidase [Schinkia azotoformans]KEF38296.1 alpha/beta superfamily hydrolase [Schinkia azotoformans MEV2011]MEC1694040.1 prolyl oligopeptidase family serine peptidase [Schinkia azotoformans]MEC1715752.1 prolyl oligopeptidase family serine peptidase [Schinkia azotoformans]MEC1724955.1 prolyl oligopeptidase family serine peptidase [Schinkia azotoformans]MEC1741391.1 prolyl oligopeptidase family serine peptidase [Schinkia azotoformans]